MANPWKHEQYYAMIGNLEKVKAFVEAHPERLNEVTFQPQKGRRRTLKELTFCWMLSVGK